MQSANNIAAQEISDSCAYLLKKAGAEDSRIVARHRYYAVPEQLASDLCERYARWLETKLAAGTYVGWLVFDGDRAIAGAGGVVLDWGPTKDDPSFLRGRIVNAFTEAPWRRQGIGTKLIDLVLSDLRALGIDSFTLASTEDSAGVYSRLGFRPYTAEMVMKCRVSDAAPFGRRPD